MTGGVTRFVVSLALAGSGAAAGFAAARANAVTARTEAARIVAGPRFAKLPAGWRFYGDSPVLLSGAGAHSDTFATSWNFRRSSVGGWLGNLPRNAAGIEVLLVRHATAATKDRCGYPVTTADYALLRRKPIRLRDLVSGPSDDNPRTLDLSLRANVRNLYTMDLRVEFGSLQPSTALRQSVDQALTKLVLPDWPTRC